MVSSCSRYAVVTQCPRTQFKSMLGLFETFRSELEPCVAGRNRHSVLSKASSFRSCEEERRCVWGGLAMYPAGATTELGATYI